MGAPRLGLVLLTLVVGLGPVLGAGPYDWAGYDKFDEINDRMDRVNKKNCASKPEEMLYLPEGTLAQMPRFNQLLTQVIYPNRTGPLHVHNMALNRAFFYSYMNYKLNESNHFHLQPGLMYYYFSAAADVSANEYTINGSAVFYDRKTSFVNWYEDLAFNDTLDLFGPRAWRFDDYNDPTNWLREPSNNTIDIIDYGAGPQSDYTRQSYKLNQFYRRWLPDDDSQRNRDSVRKHTYDIEIKYSNETGKFLYDQFEGMSIFGPPSPGIKDTDNQPVVWTQPYYDCGRSNKWIVSAVAPVLDHLARYLEWMHIRRHRFVAVTAMDMDFLSVDINPCPIGPGNEAPNYFAGTARCRPTTSCEPLHGWGFRRGGYKCMCRPGYRYPYWQEGPFMGIDIETATEEEYRTSFDCLRVGLQQSTPIIRGLNGTLSDFNRQKRAIRGHHHSKDKKTKKHVYGGEFGRKDRHRGFKTVSKVTKADFITQRRRKYLEALGLEEQKLHDNRVKIQPRQSHAKHHGKEDKKEKKNKKKSKLHPRYQRDTAHVRKKRQAFDMKSFERMQFIISKKERVTKDNCHRLRNEDLELPGDVSYNVEKVFSSQAKTALRLAHFLSNFLQNIDVYEEYGNLRGDKLLNVEQLFGEVLANVMGDLRMKGSGVFYDVDKYRGPKDEKRQFFGPYAYRADDADQSSDGDVASTTYRAIDFAGFPKHYLDKDWFKNVKERWQSNTYGLTKYTEKPMIRSDLEGSSLKRFEMYPMYYYAPSEQDGWWSAPYFDCNGYVNDWIVTYSVPFFGVNSIGTALEFKGVVIVDVKLDMLDINQCPMEFYEPNAFKGTARCDYESTYCVPLPGLKFSKGGYKCECRVGYEYPFEDRAWYFDGQTMESEYEKKIMGLVHKFDTLKCRIAGAGRAAHSGLLLLCLLLINLVKNL